MSHKCDSLFVGIFDGMVALFEKLNEHLLVSFCQRSHMHPQQGSSQDSVPVFKVEGLGGAITVADVIYVMSR